MTLQPPEFQETLYNCPHCGGLAQQSWQPFLVAGGGRTGVYRVHCAACKAYHLWMQAGATFYRHPDGGLIHPAAAEGPQAPADLPEAVSSVYEEARQVFESSPRAASALLRLTLEGVLLDRYPDVGNLSSMIGAAKRDGLADSVIRAMDLVRVNGNDSVHELHLDDTRSTAQTLFSLLHIIVQRLISEPNEITRLYEALPEGKRDHIDRRDAPEKS